MTDSPQLSDRRLNKPGERHDHKKKGEIENYGGEMSITPIFRQVCVDVPPAVAKKAMERVGENDDRSCQYRHLRPVLKAKPAVQPPGNGGQIPSTDEGEDGGKKELTHDDSFVGLACE